MFEQSLADIYDSQASKFSSTRQKHRPEMDYIIDTISKSVKKSTNINIVEVGCGDGRLLWVISDKLEYGSFHYTGVDISKWLLNIANHRLKTKDQRQSIHFIHTDMISYLQSVEQRSVDIIVGVASVQHLFPHRVRQQFFDLAQQALRPWWVIILTNRARSDRAREKYSRPRSFHLRQWMQTGCKRWSGDQMIPRIDPDTRETHQRYYHFFSLSELRSHLAQGRDIRTLSYINRDGELRSSVRHARNSLLIAYKDIR